MIKDFSSQPMFGCQENKIGRWKKKRKPKTLLKTFKKGELFSSLHSISLSHNLELKGLYNKFNNLKCVTLPLATYYKENSQTT